MLLMQEQDQGTTRHGKIRYILPAQRAQGDPARTHGSRHLSEWRSLDVGSRVQSGQEVRKGFGDYIEPATGVERRSG